MTWCEWLMSDKLQEFVMRVFPLLLLSLMSIVIIVVTIGGLVAMISAMLPKSPRGKWVRHKIRKTVGLCLYKPVPVLNRALWYVEAQTTGVMGGQWSETQTWHRNEFEFCEPPTPSCDKPACPLAK